jgi:hypothetical protein
MPSSRLFYGKGLPYEPKVCLKTDLDIFYELCERVSGYYLAERYPPLGIGELSKRDLERDIEEARKLIQSLFPNEPLAP